MKLQDGTRLEQIKMLDAYTTKQIATLYGVTVETVRLWSEEFNEYLSPTANPGRYKTRYFTDEDMGVVTLVAESKKEGLTYTEIHAALKIGDRGISPPLAPEDIRALSISSQDQRLSLRIEHLELTIQHLINERDAARGIAAKSQEFEKDNIRLQVKLEMIQAQLVAALEDARVTVNTKDELLREIGRLQGELDALRRQQDNS